MNMSDILRVKLQYKISMLNSNLDTKQSKMMYATTELPGTGYNFIFLSAPNGYFLVSASLWTNDTMGIVTINKINDTIYALVFSGNTSTDVTYSIECIWTKID